MKKILTAIICLVLSLFVFAGCGNSTELTISIGDGQKDNDAVSVLLKYNDTWKSGEKIFTVNYGHGGGAVERIRRQGAGCQQQQNFRAAERSGEIGFAHG